MAKKTTTKRTITRRVAAKKVATRVSSIQKVDTAFKRFLTKIAKLTNDNFHQKAKLEIAKYFKMKDYEKIFSAIIVIHETEGYMEEELYKYSNNKAREMLKKIELKHGKTVVNQIKKNL